ncbi:MerR family transcriptional regulator [Flexivirga caeni]|uniref:MerR family transcriptional regulator n=2 Tax=Flexivirga caeni TaxID=2294115 RepID=A0A3M9MJX9_9MICO|nr:MerR family transcriptional regulator [Flexivirga caeni]
MKRIPLRLEVAGTKIDASYPPDRAYNAGREGGVVEGLEAAIEAAELSAATGSDVEQLLSHLRRTRELELPPASTNEDRETPRPALSEGTSPASEGVGYRGPAVCRAAGVTYRQLDYWARTGLVTPSIRNVDGSPHSRLYSFEDTVAIAATKRLLDAGVSLQQIRGTIAYLREKPSTRWADVTLMSDGQSVYESTATDQALTLLTTGRAMYGISIGPLSEEIRSKLGEVPSEDANG